MNIAKLFVRDPNIHIVGCLDPNSSQEVKMPIYSKVPVSATSIRFLCRNCDRYHIWPLDPKLRAK